MKNSIQAIQNEIIEEFEDFSDWEEKYSYIIELGSDLEELDDKYKNAENLVKGCQSQVWLVAEGSSEKLVFHAISDSAIVSGLIALLLRVYSGRSAHDILSTEPRFVEHIGLAQHLSPTRSTGLFAMMRAIKNHAHAALASKK